MKKLFNNINISWIFLLIFSLITGLVVGILNRIPVLNDTSFQDIAIYLEMWIILAIFIINNTKSAKEAMIKCFIFFLISQPLIYLTEIIIDCIFKNEAFLSNLVLYFKNYYFHNGWFLYTLLTIPGAYIAYYIKKDNIISTLILSVACLYLSYVGIQNILDSIFFNFPRHLLNGSICIIMAFYFPYILLSKNSNKILSIILSIIMCIISTIFFYNKVQTPIFANEIIDVDYDAIEYKILNKDIASINLDQNEIIIYSGIKVGKTTLIVKDSMGVEHKYSIISTCKNFIINEE